MELHRDHSHEELLENVDLAVLWFFAAELAARLWITRLGFFRSLWSCFDAANIVVALLPVAGGGIAVLRLARLARSMHLLRHVSHLRLKGLWTASDGHRGRRIGGALGIGRARGALQPSGTRSLAWMCEKRLPGFGAGQHQLLASSSWAAASAEGASPSTPGIAAARW